MQSETENHIPLEKKKQKKNTTLATGLVGLKHRTTSGHAARAAQCWLTFVQSSQSRGQVISAAILHRAHVLHLWWDTYKSRAKDTSKLHKQMSETFMPPTTVAIVPLYYLIPMATAIWQTRNSSRVVFEWPILVWEWPLKLDYWCTTQRQF